MKILNANNFALWWRLARNWFSTKFDAINVDMSPIEKKIDDLAGANSTETFDNGESIPACLFEGYHDIVLEDGKYFLKEESEVQEEEAIVGDIFHASEVPDDAEFLLVKSITFASIGISNVKKIYGNYYLDVQSIDTIKVEKNKNYICTGSIALYYTGTGPTPEHSSGTLYLWDEYKGKSIYDATEEVKDAIAEIDLSSVAKQGSDSTKSITTLDASLGDVQDALDYMEQHIMPEYSNLAKQGSNANANISDIQAAIGTPASGQPSDLFAAIAANAGIPTMTIPASTSSQELAPNTLYIFAERTADLTLTLGSPITGIANEYHCFIIVGGTAPTITWPSGISWNGGSAPTIAASKTYEVSILNNVAAYFEV